MQLGKFRGELMVDREQLLLSCLHLPDNLLNQCRALAKLGHRHLQLIVQVLQRGVEAAHGLEQHGLAVLYHHRALGL